jgi:hypothetical protein
MKYKINQILEDDVKELYVVKEVFENTCIVCPLNNKENLSCEIMEYTSIESEDWKIIGQLK